MGTADKTSLIDLLSTTGAANFATSVGTLIAVISLLVIAYQSRLATQQARLSRSYAEGELLLRLEELSYKHAHVHRSLREDSNYVPSTNADWDDVDNHLGFFEFAELLIRKKILDEAEFLAMFKYRIENICENKAIVDAKFKAGEKKYWENFIALAKRADIEI